MHIAKHRLSVRYCQPGGRTKKLLVLADPAMTMNELRELLLRTAARIYPDEFSLESPAPRVQTKSGYDLDGEYQVMEVFDPVDSAIAIAAVDLALDSEVASDLNTASPVVTKHANATTSTGPVPSPNTAPCSDLAADMYPAVSVQTSSDMDSTIIHSDSAVSIVSRAGSDNPTANSRSSPTPDPIAVTPPTTNADAITDACLMVSVSGLDQNKAFDFSPQSEAAIESILDLSVGFRQSRTMWPRSPSLSPDLCPSSPSSAYSSAGSSPILRSRVIKSPAPFQHSFLSDDDYVSVSDIELELDQAEREEPSITTGMLDDIQCLKDSHALISKANSDCDNSGINNSSINDNIDIAFTEPITHATPAVSKSAFGPDALFVSLKDISSKIGLSNITSLSRLTATAKQSSQRTGTIGSSLTSSPTLATDHGSDSDLEELESDTDDDDSSDDDDDHFKASGKGHNARMAGKRRTATASSHSGGAGHKKPRRNYMSALFA